jgi:hypothetical protein
VSTRTVTAVSANLHNERPVARRLLAMDPNIAGVHEAQDCRRILARSTRHDYHTGPKTGDRNMTQETGVLVRPGYGLRGTSTDFMSEEWGPAPRIGMVRFGNTTTVQITDAVTLAVIPWHPIAGPDALRKGVDDPVSRAIIARYRQALRWLDLTLEFHNAMGHESLVCADAQMFEGWDQPWSPKVLFESHGMRWHWERIDVMAWTAGLGTPKTGVHDIGSNHPALSAKFTIER